MRSTFFTNYQCVTNKHQGRPKVNGPIEGMQDITHHIIIKHQGCPKVNGPIEGMQDITHHIIIKRGEFREIKY